MMLCAAELLHQNRSLGLDLPMVLPWFVRSVLNPKSPAVYFVRMRTHRSAKRIPKYYPITRVARRFEVLIMFRQLLPSPLRGRRNNPRITNHSSSIVFVFSVAGTECLHFF